MISSVLEVTWEAFFINAEIIRLSRDTVYEFVVRMRSKQAEAQIKDRLRHELVRWALLSDEPIFLVKRGCGEQSQARPSHNESSRLGLWLQVLTQLIGSCLLWTCCHSLVSSTEKVPTEFDGTLIAEMLLNALSYRESDHLFDGERESERERMCVNVWERKKECVSGRERTHQKERECVCVWLFDRFCVCVCLWERERENNK